MTTINIVAAAAAMVAANRALSEAADAWQAQFDAEHPEGAIAAFFAGPDEESDELKALTATLTECNIAAHEAREAFYAARGW